MQRQFHTIDATDKALGRLASDIAFLLHGKNRVDFDPRLDSGAVVTVTGVEKMKITGKKLEQKMYYRHSGYPGGLKTTQMKKLMAEKPREVLKKAVYNMLPKNKLRAEMIKRLRFAN
ncbi:50S ribosomal protein L13 [Candidatus Falkowbacteria bacterium RIFOXYD2_FULL_35_9]|uniref:Large ribosomal subunit protein uL13 n=1 Tax=Candidatus Falkowbacteria bacterium RIFOXYC2_FULL_36_12 TaxID=1798002 RepID=A0A1F5SZ35_9BACT|nr:MAG: 50S ribosomal protein L13 [Candidatus Falkowbacteria bacterium RIFOXYC2_FULL_36_12]OGF33162.1 MAG: 50S ribosomal protein L13 [Candidatus Falkowbacteria bacterium RIFOXYA2_FULL_35_8]OGF46192.1 MAG: 50S ribosomal protein L13 [Candidatus Falkowbacteria bacterium RIFOXYD2_FULL_35_9]